MYQAFIASALSSNQTELNEDDYQQEFLGLKLQIENCCEQQQLIPHHQV